MAYYTASKTRSQGRGGWTVIFRHPLRLDPSTGRPGRRVRRGLGTSDDEEANRLVNQLDVLLSSEEYWDISQRQVAEQRFDERVVDIFYDGVGPSAVDHLAIRDEMLPLPTAAEGYQHVMLLGTTGAGKTTVLRQILHTDPKTERFPSTSTAKTTVADTEIALTEDEEFEVVVTFVGKDEVIDYLGENASDAALALYRGRSRSEALRRLLDHVNQRFRFSYLLGRPSVDADGDDDDDVDDDSDAGASTLDVDEFGEIDLGVTSALLMDIVGRLEQAAGRVGAELDALVASSPAEQTIGEEELEDLFDAEVRGSDEFHFAVDSLMDEIERRFELLTVGSTVRNRQGWPLAWAWRTTNRDEFIATVMRFSSNYAPLFGRLLTPLVNGLRVAGPFRPAWADSTPRLVLIDGEGLGHTPNSAARLSTSVARRLDAVDAVVLVDNAAQPMQAAPVAALKTIAASGNGSKLFLLFTHLDQVTGDNLPTFTAKEEHVLASVENVLKAIGDEAGRFAERVLRQRVDEASFFVGGIQDELDPTKKAGKRAIGELVELVGALERLGGPVHSGPSKPVYDRMNLSLAVAQAAQSFHAKWNGLLGIDAQSDHRKEHWTRVKALSRRLAEGWSNEYDTLKPVADLLYELQVQVYRMLQQPVRWENGDPTDDEAQLVIDELSQAITRGLFALTERRIKVDAQRAWQDAYSQRGTGSTYVRARIIAHEVYDRGAPIPTAIASPDKNSFLHDVARLVAEVATEHELVLE